MTIEQRPELNRFVDPSIPLTWNWRWRQVKVTLPIWCFGLVCLAEQWLFKAWLSNYWHWDRPLIIVGAWLAMVLFVISAAEFQTRMAHRSKRLILFQAKKVRLKPCKINSFPWKKLAKFQFEPIPEMPSLTKLKILLHGFPGQKPAGRAFWQMVLEHPSQVQELMRYLQTRKVEAPTNFEIEVLERPIPAVPPNPVPLLGMSLYMSGMFFLLHGVPILLVGLPHTHHDADGSSKLTPEESAKLFDFVSRYFPSRAEFQHFSLALGIGLIGVGMVCLVLGWRLMGRKQRVESPLEPA